MTTLDRLRISRLLLIEIAKRFGARKLRVFGSVARGDDRENSDVDFLVDMEQGRSLVDLAGLQQELEKQIGRSVDVLTERGINQYLKDRILKEAIDL